jgi:hypothetical protein
MNRWAKVGLVLAGYVAAIAAAALAAWVYDVRVSALPYDTSGGMYAGGQLLTSLGAFFVVALVPTVLALWFLRGHHGFWNTVAVVAIGFALAGLAAVLIPLVVSPASRNVGVMFVDLFGLAHLLGAPLWIAGLVLFAILSPTRFARRTLLAAVGIELAVGVCALVHWFTTRPPF